MRLDRLEDEYLRSSPETEELEVIAARIPVGEPDIGDEELRYATDAIKSGWVSSRGKYVKKFEEEFARYCGTKYAISCCNGTSAIHLALLSLGVGEGSEVIIPVSTYVATANATRYVNATPIPVDSDLETWTIDTNQIEGKISEKTRAIIPVHLYGIPCEMDKILEISRKYNLPVIEDCAEAHGAEYGGKKVGNLGEIGCFSFFGNKIITTGEGGMCVTNDVGLKEKMEKLRNQGTDDTKKYWHDIVGYNYRMTNVQAAIGLAQLEKIDAFLERRDENARLYSTFLADVPGIGFIPRIEDRKNVYWMNIILSDRRDEIIRNLEEDNIETRPFFVPINKMPHYHSTDSYPVAEELYRRGINLPSSVKLKKEEIERVCNIIKKTVRDSM